MEVFNNVKWVKIGFKDECEKKSSFFATLTSLDDDAMRDDL